MRIVKISDMSEEEKKKVWEKQQERARIIEENRVKANALKRNTNSTSQKSYNLPTKDNKVYVSSTRNVSTGDSFFKKSDSFSDGYQFGDITGTTLATVGDVGINVTKGIAKLGEGLGDAVSYGIADIHDWVGNDNKANAIRERTKQNVIDSLFEPTEKYLDKYSVLGEKSDSISEGLGYVAGITAASIATGGAATALGASAAAAGTAATIGSTAMTFTSSLGHSITEALNDGATIDEARIYGVISASAEAGSELLFGGLGKVSSALGLSKGALDDVVIGGLTKNIKNKMVKTVIQSGLKTTGEGLEELVSGFISAVGKKATYMKEKDFRKILNDENLAEQFWMGTLTSAIAQGPSTIRSIRNGTDYITGESQKSINNSLANQTNTVYNTNESESGVNGQIQREGMEGISGQFSTSISEKNTENNRQYTTEEYRKFEESIQPTNETDITDEQKTIKNNIKRQYGKDIVFFDGNNNSYTAGASLNNKEKIYIDKKIADYYGTNKIINHEIMESDIRHNRELSNDIIMPAIQKIMNDTNFQKQKEIFWNGQNENIPSDYAIAKELLCDRFAEIKTNEKWDYDNVLSQETNMTIDYSLENFHKELYGNNISANLQQNGTNNQNILQGQQITSQENKMAQNGISEQENTSYISEEFKKGLEKFKSGKYNQMDNITVLNETPQWLYNKGYDYEQPIVLNMDKLSTIMKEPKGLFNGKNQHGITMDLIEKLPEAINNPLNVIKNPKYNNRYVVVTSLTDQYGDIILVPIEMNGKGYINGIETDLNKVSSMYGKEYYDLPKSDKIDSYMEQNKNNIVYDIDTYNKRAVNDYRLQLPSTDNSSGTVDNVPTSNNSIPHATKVVNSDTNITNNYMPNVENNSQIPYENANNITETGYTQKEIENITSDKITVARKVDDIVGFAKRAMKIPGNAKMYVSKISNNISQKIKNELGIDTNGYNISLSTDGVRHSIKNHSDTMKEQSRGQIPITVEDFKNIPQIINEADNITNAGESKQGKPAIRFEKNIDGNNIVITYVSDKHKNLEFQTMYKFKNNKSLVTESNEKSLDRTSKTNSDTAFVNTSNTSITQNSDFVKNSSTTNNSMQNDENNSLKSSAPREVDFIKAPPNENQKSRKHYKSIIESQYTSDEAKAIAKELMGSDTYVPETNNKQLEEADKRIELSGADSELDTLMSRAITGGNIKSVDIAVGERLIQYYSKIGDKTKLRDAIQATAMAGTTAGQTVQAMSLLNHQTPEGQAIWLQRSVDKMNTTLKRVRGEKAEQFNLTPEMLEKITSSKNEQELETNISEVYKELGQQVTKSLSQKIDSWRYFCMLANPKTHIKNIGGNMFMGLTQSAKNKVAGVIESVASKINPEMERTHTIVPASQEVLEFAKSDIINVADRLGLNDNKYNPKTRLENSMRTFKHDSLENTIGKAFDLNDNALEAEDGWGLKAGYKRALAEYMTANKLTPDNITDKQLAMARNYAVEQAQEATFHQYSQLASLLNQLSNKNKFAKFALDALLPFKKTQINIAKAGLEYNPVGLVKSIVYDSVQLRKGNITVNQYIDNISKGLTGTGLALIGYALSSCGILKASGSDDDKKETFDENQGKQTYSIQIGEKTYSLDWISPTAIPLFIGAEIHEYAQFQKETNSSSTDENSQYNQILNSGVNLLNAMTYSMNPMTEMSMLSGLTSTLSSYEQGSSQMLASIGTNAVKSYVNQFVPTALGQIAKTTDEYERSTTSTKTGVLPRAVDTTKNQIMNKVPGLRQMLPVKTDTWGNDVKQDENIIKRSINNFLVPWKTKEITTSNVDESLNELYDNTGESSILPTAINKNITINGNKYQLTNEEYAEFKKNYGQISYALLNQLTSSSEYNNMISSQKQSAIEDVYTYAKEKIKVNYAKKVNKTVETSTLYDTLEALKKGNGNQSQYLSYKAKTSEITGENANKKKLKILEDSDFGNNTKQIIYQETLGKEDDTYKAVTKLHNSNNFINNYLNYKQQEKSDDKIQMLINSTFSNEEIETIYEENIKSEKDTSYNVVKYIDMDIKKYLRYKQQKFESDREDDGTEEGKAISGSKKQKVYAYINDKNNGLNYNQRLLLIGLQYKLQPDERDTLYKAIKNNNKIPLKDKLEIYKKLKGFTVYRDGMVRY